MSQKLIQLFRNKESLQGINKGHLNQSLKYLLIKTLKLLKQTKKTFN